MKNLSQIDEEYKDYGESLEYNDTASDFEYIWLPFMEDQLETIIILSILMVISAIGNISLLIVIMKRKAKSRIHILIMHLAIADLFVTFLTMPFRIGRGITGTWNAGDAMCRIMAFFRTFGMFLSPFIIICMSIDRYYAVIRPLQTLRDIHKKGKVLLMLAWIGSVLCSVPQMWIYKVETHPKYTSFTQCLKVYVFSSYKNEFWYSLFVMVVTFWLPLTVIIYTNTRILIEICRKSRGTSEDQIRRSSNNFLSRARIRTLKMMITIITVFLICWIPYYVMRVWYLIDELSAVRIDLRIQRVLLYFWTISSSVNPIIYGIFNIPKRNKIQLQSYLLKPINTTMELSIIARNPIF